MCGLRPSASAGHWVHSASVLRARGGRRRRAAVAKTGHSRQSTKVVGSGHPIAVDADAVPQSPSTAGRTGRSSPGPERSQLWSRSSSSSFTPFRPRHGRRPPSTSDGSRWPHRDRTTLGQQRQGQSASSCLGRDKRSCENIPRRDGDHRCLADHAHQIICRATEPLRRITSGTWRLPRRADPGGRLRPAPGAR